MEKLLFFPPVVTQSLELLTICVCKQDVIDVEYDVMTVLGNLQSSSDLFAGDPERTALFNAAREELVAIIEDKMKEFSIAKPRVKHEQKLFSISKPVINKKVYKKPKYKNYLDVEVE